MSLFISAQIRKREFGRKIPPEALAVLVRTSRVALGVAIAGDGLPPGSRLIKAYATSSSGPKRVIYLLMVDNNDLFLLFYRDKNDPVGRNASMSNPAFRSELIKHLSLLEKDIATDDIEPISTSTQP